MTDTADRVMMRLAKEIQLAIQNHKKRVLFPDEMKECMAAALSSHGLRKATEAAEMGVDTDYRPNSMDKKYGLEGVDADAHALKIYARHLEALHAETLTALLGEDETAEAEEQRDAN